MKNVTEISQLLDLGQLFTFLNSTANLDSNAKAYFELTGGALDFIVENNTITGIYFTFLISNTIYNSMETRTETSNFQEIINGVYKNNSLEVWDTIPYDGFSSGYELRNLIIPTENILYSVVDEKLYEISQESYKLIASNVDALSIVHSNGKLYYLSYEQDIIYFNHYDYSVNQTETFHLDLDSRYTTVVDSKIVEIYVTNTGEGFLVLDIFTLGFMSLAIMIYYRRMRRV